MKLKNLEGKVVTVDTRQTTFPLRGELASKSKIQFACGQLIKSKFPADTILEEFSLPGNSTLFLDFYLPSRKIAFEIQGRQHKEYVPFFHGSPAGFKEAVGRDTAKRRWCEINGITLYAIDSIKDLAELL